MKKIIIYTIISIFMFTGLAFSGQRGDRHQNNKQQYRQKRDYKNHYKRPNNHGYRYKYHGQRQYHPKHYRGHWRSWKSWNDHYRYNRKIYRHGRYYRNHGSLYFEFETDEGMFAFSIGR